MTGGQWGYIELRCSSRTVRLLGELPQASGDLYDNSAHWNDDRGYRKNNG